MIIITDSAADMSKEEAESLGVHVAPLHIQFPEGGVSSEEITPDEFYARLKAMEPEIPTTSQPSAGSFTNIYKKFENLKEEILSIHISSGLSGTLESARLGAESILQTKIHHFDSMTLSGGQRFQVLAAAKAVKNGWGKQAIFDRLKAIREQTEVIYTLETLKYLARGGRIGRVQALAGLLLKVKPIIKVDKTDGKYSTVGKARTVPKALTTIQDYLSSCYGTDTPLLVSVMHGQYLEQAKVLAGMLQEKLNVTRLEILRISPVLGVHTGPGVVGAAVVPAHLVDNIE
ncbi:MAG: DegV family protein [Chloroflexi bacterium]|nr:MAG: DegV family protein [Chloroflexota bacterium]